MQGRPCDSRAEERVGSGSGAGTATGDVRPGDPDLEDELYAWLACEVSSQFCALRDSVLSCSSPRDAVTISRTFNDATTLIDISTSLPRSPDEPAYLRPSPPYVRSEVGRKPLLHLYRTS